ncbi:unnamed protein product, partial [Phaeothamnion confervicola]
LVAFDPLTPPLEAATLAALGVGALPENEQGKRAAGGVTTLFFAPHCPMRLYSNILWANWGGEPFVSVPTAPRCLSDVLILGNSLVSYGDRLVSAADGADPTNCVLRVLPLLRETRLEPEADGERRRLKRRGER